MSESDATAAVEYRPLSGYPGYRVGDDGTVWSRWARKGRAGCILGSRWRKLKHYLNRYGYPTVGPSNGRHQKTLTVHRLVLEAFVGPRPHGYVAAHNNGIRTDNRLSNLRWDTQAGNLADKHRHGTHQCGEKHGGARLTAEDVQSVFRLANQGLMHAEIADQLQTCRATISHILTQRLWSHVATPDRRRSSLIAQQRAISQLLGSGMNTQEIGQWVGVSRAMINAVRRGDRTMRLAYEIRLESASDILFRPDKTG